MTMLRMAILAAALGVGAAAGTAAMAADASGVATGGSAGATSTQPGPSTQPGTKPPVTATPERSGEAPPAAAGSAAGAGQISADQVRQALQAAGYADIRVDREGDHWIADATLNGVAQRLRIDPQTGQTTRR